MTLLRYTKFSTNQQLCSIEFQIDIGKDAPAKRGHNRSVFRPWLCSVFVVRWSGNLASFVPANERPVKVALLQIHQFSEADAADPIGQSAAEVWRKSVSGMDCLRVTVIWTELQLCRHLIDNMLRSCLEYEIRFRWNYNMKIRFWCIIQYWLLNWYLNQVVW